MKNGLVILAWDMEMNGFKQSSATTQRLAPLENG
jgi:hypothetical protein